MKKRFILAAVLAGLAGTALHFLYDLIPGVLTGLISPINESVWEHLKLLFWPTLAAAFVLTRKAPKPQRLWAAFFVSLLAAPLFLLGIYYLLLTGFGVERLWVDIALYYISMFFGFFLAWRLYNRSTPEKWGGFLLLLLLLYGSCLILFTFAAPPLEIFRSKV